MLFKIECLNCGETNKVATPFAQTKFALTIKRTGFLRKKVQVFMRCLKCEYKCLISEEIRR